jgi:prepilin-type N-terminal cleavage/methylation domain-containing protein
MSAPPPRARRADGFTLIELVVVVAMLSVLALFASTVVSNVLSLADGRGGDAAATALPAELSPVALLVRFAGLAVLLFGAGFWYLVELREPGRLDAFRLGHFLLLALTYSLFFAVFAVLGSHDVDAWLAVGIAAVVSWPLLVLHVATIVDGRFALTAALPLAVLTTAVVVNAVYGGSVRAFVWLGLTCAVVAHLTLTYPRLARGREARGDARARHLAEAVDALAAAAGDGRAAIADARGALALQDPVEHGALRAWVEQRADAVAKAVDEHERLAALREQAGTAADRGERRAAREVGIELARRLDVSLPRARTALLEATQALAAQRRRRGVARPAAATAEHCVACGSAHDDGARFCPACGARAAELRRCRRCDAVLRVPLHLIVRVPPEPLPPTHCTACGERHEA